MSATRKADVAKAGKRRRSPVAPPVGTTRRAIIERTSQWVEENQAKAITPKIGEVIPSNVPGFPAIRLEVIPGALRWDLARAMRRTSHTAKGNESV